MSNDQRAVARSLVGPTGPRGPQGVAGPRGATGGVGPRGPTGIRGPAGAMGFPGARGLSGAKGATGNPGPRGPTGPQGLMGPQGPIGAQGLAGPKGATGAVGAQGPAGPAGPAGPQGVEGPQGIQGIQGIQGVKGDTGSIDVENYDLAKILVSYAPSTTAGNSTAYEILVSAPWLVLNSSDENNQSFNITQPGVYIWKVIAEVNAFIQGSYYCVNIDTPSWPATQLGRQSIIVSSPDGSTPASGCIWGSHVQNTANGSVQFGGKCYQSSSQGTVVNVGYHIWKIA